MSAAAILVAFLILRVAQQLAESGLGRLNRRYYLGPAHQREAETVLGIGPEDMRRTLAYSEDKYRFGMLSTWLHLLIFLVFLAAGGLGLFEAWAKTLVAMFAGAADHPILVGLAFFAILGLASLILNVPFGWYRTFVLEQKHGFNRQTSGGFVLDLLKGVVVAVLLGTPIIALILWIIGHTGNLWWIWAWIAMSVFSILTAWLYPTLLAPLFNKFAPLPEGELKENINALAGRIGFHMAGVYVMDASKRSSHGNAYFTGVFGKKRIVLFDTLVESMAVPEVVAVLAHELGHFKLKHVFWGLIRGILMTGLTFFLLSLLLPLASFYHAFHLDGVSGYGALIVFGLWLGLLDFVTQPAMNLISRRNEFAADRFARENIGNATDLSTALLKLREKSQAMPITHPLYSSIYYSHPPLLERLEALRGDVRTAAALS